MECRGSRGRSGGRECSRAGAPQLRKGVQRVQGAQLGWSAARQGAQRRKGVQQAGGAAAEGSAPGQEAGVYRVGGTAVEVK